MFRYTTVAAGTVPRSIKIILPYFTTINFKEYDKYLVLQKLFKRYGDRGSTVVKVLCYKLESLWFDSRWCHWIFH